MRGLLRKQVAAKSACGFESHGFRTGRVRRPGMSRGGGRKGGEMSRSTAARRRRDDVDVWGAIAVASEEGDLLEQNDRLGAENARLKEEFGEVEGWYRLLQADHSALQAKMAQSSRRMTQLQAEANRLAGENQELRALVAQPLVGLAVVEGDRGEPGAAPATGSKSESGGDCWMRRITDYISSVRRYRWATAAVVAIAGLLAR